MQTYRTKTFQTQDTHEKIDITSSYQRAIYLNGTT